MRPAASRPPGKGHYGDRTGGQRCLARAPVFGIQFMPDTAASLYVSDSTITTNGAFGGTWGGGIWAVPGVSTGQKIDVTIDNSLIANNGFVGVGSDTATVAISNAGRVKFEDHGARGRVISIFSISSVRH